MDKNIIFKGESYKIVGACFEVYKCMGSGFLESVYQECLAMEFDDRNIPYIEQPNIKLKYKNRPLKK
jgi:GxxExxY protein